MSSTYQFRVLTPLTTAIDSSVVSIVAPGEAGYLGVLANHAPLIATLRGGDLRVRFENGRESVYRIGSGVLKVAHNEATLLTESFEEENE